MSLRLDTLTPSRSRRRAKRVGRGNASGHGTYSGRGQKGQRARSGGRRGLKLRGMKRAIQQLPKKRGFRSLAIRPDVVHCFSLEQFPNGMVITLDVLKEKGLVPKRSRAVKILGDGTLSKQLTIRGCAVSASAKEKIEKAGGSVV